MMDLSTHSAQFDVPLFVHDTGTVNLHEIDSGPAVDVFPKLSRRRRHQLDTTYSGLFLETKSNPEIEAMPVAITANWSRLALAGLSVDLYAKIRRMARRPRGWRGPGSQPLSSNALRGFIEFWIRAKNSAVEPVIALTSTGGIEAHWHKSKNKHLDLLFNDHERIFFGLFSTRSVHEGVDSPDRVLSFVASHATKPLLWK